MTNLTKVIQEWSIIHKQIRKDNGDINGEFIQYLWKFGFLHKPTEITIHPDDCEGLVAVYLSKILDTDFVHLTIHPCLRLPENNKFLDEVIKCHLNHVIDHSDEDAYKVLMQTDGYCVAGEIDHIFLRKKHFGKFIACGSKRKGCLCGARASYDYVGFFSNFNDIFKALRFVYPDIK